MLRIYCSDCMGRGCEACDGNGWLEVEQMPSCRRDGCTRPRAYISGDCAEHFEPFAFPLNPLAE